MCKMATDTIQGLEGLLQSLSLDGPVPAFPAADILNKPVDIARSYVAQILVDAFQCSEELAWDVIQPANDEKGDLVVVLPRLKKLKDDLSPQELANKVRCASAMCHGRDSS